MSAPPIHGDLHGLCGGSTLSKTALIRCLHHGLQQQNSPSVGLALISWLLKHVRIRSNPFLTDPGDSLVFDHKASVHVLLSPPLTPHDSSAFPSFNLRSHLHSPLQSGIPQPQTYSGLRLGIRKKLVRFPWEANSEARLPMLRVGLLSVGYGQSLLVTLT